MMWEAVTEIIQKQTVVLFETGVDKIVGPQERDRARGQNSGKKHN
jgi:hypothetical protein